MATVSIRIDDDTKTRWNSLAKAHGLNQSELFRQAMEVFTPFAGNAPKTEAKDGRKAEAKDIEDLKEQLRALQTKIENM